MMKKRVVREVKSDGNYMLSGLFGIALFIAVIASILLVGLYSPRNQTLTGDVIMNGPTGFDFSASARRIQIDANVRDGQAVIYPLYAEHTPLQYTGIGRSSNELLLTSDNESLMFDKSNGANRLFIVSGGTGSVGESYLLSVNSIYSDGGSNMTRFRNEVTQQYVCQDKKEGDSCLIGNLSFIVEKIVRVGSSGQVVLRAGSGLYFNRVYDTSGNYVILPVKSQLPASEYNFTVYSRDGTAIQKYNAYITASFLSGYVGIQGICYDSDFGTDYGVQGLASRGQAYFNDNCVNGEMLNESICDISGVWFVIYNCSNIGPYGGRCVDGACVANNPPCNPNWTAFNTSCQNDFFVTYYVDSNSCGTTEGKPQNVSVFCGLNQTGLLGTRESIGVHGVSVDLRINDEVVNYSRNYTGGIRKVSILDRSNNESIFDFNWNFSRALDLGTIFVQKQHGSSPTKGYVIVNGLGINKTVYVDKLNDFSTQVCIKDTNDTSVSGVSQLCDDDDEILLDCPGEDEGYSCDIVDYRFVVAGLRHSAVMEFVEPGADNATCVPDWQCEDWGACINNTRSRECSDINYCYDLTGKPAPNESCYEPLSNLTGAGYTPSKKCVWECTQWDPLTCPADTKMQSRTCTETNNCGSLTGKPLESKTCILQGSDTIFYVLIIVIFLAILTIIGIIAYTLIHRKPLVTESHVNPPAAPVQSGQKPFQPGQRPFQAGQPGTGAGYGPGYKPF